MLHKNNERAKILHTLAEILESRPWRLASYIEVFRQMPLLWQTIMNKRYIKQLSATKSFKAQTTLV